MARARAKLPGEVWTVDVFCLEMVARRAEEVGQGAGEGILLLLDRSERNQLSGHEHQSHGLVSKLHTVRKYLGLWIDRYCQP